MPEAPPDEADEPHAEPTPVRVPRTDLLISIAILLATFGAYSSVVRFGFLTFDDQKYVFQNLYLRDGLALGNLRWIFLSFSPDNWFPVTRLSLVLDYQLFGLRAGWYHAENVVIHGLASLLLFGFLRRATGVRWPCAFVALVFALHPLHVESVAWVAERKDVLCAFFWFAALWAWVRYTENPAKKDLSKTRYAAALGLFCLGLMSKPMIVTLPLLLFLLDLWPLRRGFSRKLALEKVPFIALSCAVMAVTIVAQRGATGFPPPLFLRLENALIAVAAYIADALWPARLWAVHAYPASLPAWQAIAAAAGILAVSAIVLRQRRQRAYLATGWFWFLVTLLPVIGLVQAGPQARADRYMYVPLVGLSIMLAWGVAGIAARWPAVRLWAAVLGPAVCAIMAVATSIQTRYWETTEGLFQHAIDMDSGNYLAWNYLGQTLADKQWFPPEVISCYRYSLAIRPDHAAAHFNLATALWAEGRQYEAIDEYEAALSLERQNAGYRSALGAALAISGRLADGLAHMEQSVRMDPDNKQAQFNLGSALMDLPGRTSDSVAHLEEAVRIDPYFTAAHVNLAAVLLRIPGRRAEAIAHLEEAQRLEPAPDRQTMLDRLKLDDALAPP